MVEEVAERLDLLLSRRGCVQTSNRARCPNLYRSHFLPDLYCRWYNRTRFPVTNQWFRYVVYEPWLRVEGVGVEYGVRQ